MEETLKLILSELKELKGKVNGLEEGQIRLEGKVTGLEGKIDKLTEREENHFNQVINEIQYLYDGLDKRITPLEAKV